MGAIPAGIWDECNLKAVGCSKEQEVLYSITIEEPSVLSTTDKDRFLTLRSICIRNKIKFTESTNKI